MSTPICLTSSYIIPRQSAEFIPSLLTDFAKQLIVPNPKYVQAKRLGLSTYHIPPEIKLFSLSEDKKWVTVHRGDVERSDAAFAKLLRDGAIKYKDLTATRPSPVTYTNTDFTLAPHQIRCVDLIAEKRQGIILAATASGKSAIIMAAIGKLKQRTLIVVNRTILLKQLKASAEKWLNVPIGEISGSRRDIQDVTIAVDKSLSRMIEAREIEKDAFGVLFFDECHVAAIPTMQRILDHFTPSRLYGLTGTLKRKDGFEFMVYSRFGNVIATVEREELEEADRVSPVNVAVLTTTLELSDAGDSAETPAALWRISEKEVHESKERTGLIVTCVENILKENQNTKVAIVWRYLNPCADTQAMLRERGIPSALIVGKSDQAEGLRKILSGEVRVVVATIPVFATGVDIPDLTDLVLASPMFTNDLLLKQLRGRLMRKAKGKTHGTFHFIFDHLIFESHRLRRALRSLNS
jgi:superfamily II DNA or RNA helicase